jgi:DNA-binding MarR family transcriptional regulator
MPSANTSFRHPSSSPARRSRKPNGNGDRAQSQSPSSADTPALNTTALEQLLGYAARRTALTIIESFLHSMKPHGLRPVEFSILCLIADNPGVTARQLCAALSLQPPNLVAPLDDFAQRGLIERRAHPQDGRAWGLHATASGQTLMRKAHAQALALELGSTPRLTERERASLLRLLQKVYK